LADQKKDKPMTSSKPIPKALLDELLKDYKGPQDLLGESGLIKQLTKQLAEAALEAEMTTHLGYERHAAEGRGRAATAATGRLARPSRAKPGSMKSRCRGIVRAALSRS
jgi:putative transposase